MKGWYYTTLLSTCELYPAGYYLSIIDEKCIVLLPSTITHHNSHLEKYNGMGGNYITYQSTAETTQLFKLINKFHRYKLTLESWLLSLFTLSDLLWLMWLMWHFTFSVERVMCITPNSPNTIVYYVHVVSPVEFQSMLGKPWFPVILLASPCSWHLSTSASMFPNLLCESPSSREDGVALAR